MRKLALNAHGIWSIMLYDIIKGLVLSFGCKLTSVYVSINKGNMNNKHVFYRYFRYVFFLYFSIKNKDLQTVDIIYLSLIVFDWNIN